MKKLTNAKVHAALLRSIVIWSERAAGDSQTGEACPLCKLLPKRAPTGNVCSVCPVKAYTGETSCLGTPYYVAREADFAPGPSKIELEFLRRVEHHYFGPGSARRVAKQLASGLPGRAFKAGS
jgi:hypothetical protein